MNLSKTQKDNHSTFLRQSCLWPAISIYSMDPPPSTLNFFFLFLLFLSTYFIDLICLLLCKELYIRHLDDIVSVPTFSVTCQHTREWCGQGHG